MDVSHEQATVLVNQVQRSHRLLAGFYQRILPSLDDISASFGANFWYWSPIAFDRPCMGSTKPSRKWGWDYLPMVASQFLYVRSDTTDPVFIELRLHTDPAILPGQRSPKGEPAPANLPDAEPALRIYLYWLVPGSSVDIKSEWEEVEHPGGEADSVTRLSENLWGTWMDIPLADHIVAPQETIARISKHISLPTSGG